MKLFKNVWKQILLKLSRQNVYGDLPGADTVAVLLSASSGRGSLQYTVYRQETTMVLAGKREYKIEITKTRARQNVTGSIVLLSEPGRATTFEHCDNATMYQVFWDTLND